MKLSEQMVTALSLTIADTEETLFCPIICMPDMQVYKNSFLTPYYFMGMTEEHLLYCSSLFGNVVSSTKIPLRDIVSARIEPRAFGNMIIHFIFKSHAPISVTVSPRAIGLKTQSENLNEFISRLNESADSDTEKAVLSDLSSNGTEGKNIRHQYFNAVLCLFLFGLYLCIVIMTSTMLVKVLKGDTSDLFNDWQELVVMTLSYLTLLSPLLLLSLTNRLFYGRTICTADKDGLRLPSGFLYKWNSIKRVVYTPNIMSRTRMSYCYLTVELKDNTSVDICHFPIYGMMILRKYAPHITTGLSKTCRFAVAIYFLFPVALAIFFMLII